MTHNLTKPDIILITGDLVDSSRTDIDVALAFAGEAAGIAPTYYVTGNHEAVISQYDVLKSGLEMMGVIVLEDEAISLEYNGENIITHGISFNLVSVCPAIPDVFQSCCFRGLRLCGCRSD